MIWGAVERAYPLNAPNRKICGFAANFSEKRKGASRPCSALRALRAETVILAYLETVMVAFNETCDNVPHEVVALI